MVKMASAEALFDLLINGSQIHKSFEKRSIDRLNALYGPEDEVNLPKGSDANDFYNW